PTVLLTLCSRPICLFPAHPLTEVEPTLHRLRSQLSQRPQRFHSVINITPRPDGTVAFSKSASFRVHFRILLRPAERSCKMATTARWASAHQIHLVDAADGRAIRVDT